MLLLEAKGLRVPPAETGSPAPLPGPVDISLSAGELLAVLGPSGSGKTTLLRCLALLEPRAKGSVSFQGEPIPAVETPSFRRRVLYLPQQAPPVPMKVGESLAEPFSFKSSRGVKLDQEAASMLFDRLLLPSDVWERWVPDLSVGEAQRVALVRALLLRPLVLLLDEFTSALDSAGLARAEALVREWIAKEDRAAVLVSHDEKQALRMATRTLRLEAGATKPEESEE